MPFCLQFQRKLQELREKQRKATSELNEKNKALAKMSDDVDGSRRKLDERGSIMADGGKCFKFPIRF